MLISVGLFLALFANVMFYVNVFCIGRKSNLKSPNTDAAVTFAASAANICNTYYALCLVMHVFQY